MTDKDLRNRFPGGLFRTHKSERNESLKALGRRDSRAKNSSPGLCRDLSFRRRTDRFLSEESFSFPQAAFTARMELDQREAAAGTKFPIVNFKRFQ